MNKVEPAEMPTKLQNIKSAFDEQIRETARITEEISSAIHRLSGFTFPDSKGNHIEPTNFCEYMEANIVAMQYLNEKLNILKNQLNQTI